VLSRRGAAATCFAGTSQRCPPAQAPFAVLSSLGSRSLSSLRARNKTTRNSIRQRWGWGVTRDRAPRARSHHPAGPRPRLAERPRPGQDRPPHGRTAGRPDAGAAGRGR
jgi:hypothetical protein